MKNRLFYLVCIIVGSQLFSGCKKELDVNPQERITLDNYYKTEADAFAGLVAVYDRFGFQAGGLYDKASICDVAGDDQLAGGGGPTDINDLQVMQTYTLSSTSGPQGYLWNKSYSGIFRANILLSKIDGIQMDAAKKARFIAEVKTMRASFYFDLVTFFKNVPLIEGTVDPKDLYNIEQTTPDKIYAYVEKDLNDAIPGFARYGAGRHGRGPLNQGRCPGLAGQGCFCTKRNGRPQPTSLASLTERIPAFRLRYMATSYWPISGTCGRRLTSLIRSR